MRAERQDGTWQHCCGEGMPGGEGRTEAPSFEGKRAWEAYARKSTARTLKEMRHQYQWVWPGGYTVRCWGHAKGRRRNDGRLDQLPPAATDAALRRT